MILHRIASSFVRPLKRNLLTGKHRPAVRTFAASSNNPQQASSRLPAAAAVLAVVGGGAGYFLYHNSEGGKQNRRYQDYKLSSSKRHQLAVILVSPHNRKDITRVVNKLIDVPGMGERVEGALIRQAVDRCMDTLEQILLLEAGENGGEEDDDESWLVQELNQESNEEDRMAANDFLVNQINEKVNLYGLSEAQEAVLVRGLVQQLIAVYPGVPRLLCRLGYV